MSSSSNPLPGVLDRMGNSDPDYRYMACQDLIDFLKTDKPRCDSDTQKKVRFDPPFLSSFLFLTFLSDSPPFLQLCRGIIKLLKDSSSEVQGMAMKSLAPLAKFVADDFAVYLVGQLLEPIVDGSSCARNTGSGASAKSTRDVAFLGLKSILTELPAGESKSETIAQVNVPKILQAISNTSKSEDVHIEALELLNELLKKLGETFAERHEKCMRVIVEKLDSRNNVIRKRAIGCLGSLGVVCDRKLFESIMNCAISYLTNNSSDLHRRTGVQAVWALARTSGVRLGPFLEIINPILFKFCTSDTYQDDDELREQCVQAMESFVVRCRKQMAPSVSQMKDILLALAKYDPNYAGDDDDDNSDQEMEAEDDEDDAFFDDDDDDFSDDEDSSWKVRRASIRCIRAVISAQLLPISELYSVFALFLVSRFKERAENVKLDVFGAFTTLLQVRTTTINNSNSSLLAPLNSADSMDVSGDFYADMEVDSSEPKEIAPLLEHSSRIVRTVRKELGSNSNKTRINAMSVLCELVTAAPSGYCPLFGELVPEVERALADDTAQLKTEALRFLKGVVGGGELQAVTPYVKSLVPKILAAAEDRYYKITAESLRLCTAFVTKFGSAPDDCRSAMQPHCSSIYDVAESRIIARDQDTEVKEAALDCVGGVVAHFGDALDEKRLSSVGKTLCGRLKSEVTRIASVHAMLQISRSEMRGVFLPVSGVVTSTVVSFLRKNNPSLRAASLELLASLPKLDDDGDVALLKSVSSLISDSDMKLSHFALRLSSSLVKARGSKILPMLMEPDGVYPRVKKLATSLLLQGRVVQSLLEFFKDLSIVNGDPLKVDVLTKDLQVSLEAVDMSAALITSRSSSMSTLAKCLAVVCSGAPSEFCNRFAASVVRDISSGDVRVQVFSLVTLGEFGKEALLVKETGEQHKVQEAILNVLDSSVIEVKTAAALAVGGIASAAGPEGIPGLVEMIHERPQIRYLLLLSLKDAINFSPAPHVANSSTALLSLLLEAIPQTLSALASDGDTPEPVSEAESIRIAASECLGLLMQGIPGRVIPTMRQSASSENPDVRATVVTALRFAVSTRFSEDGLADSFVKKLKPGLAQFVHLISDEDVVVAKNSLQAVHALARSRPHLLAPLMGDIMPRVFKRTEKNPDLVRKVDLGPFQHEEDFGLDLRKGAFGILHTVIGGPLVNQVPMGTFLECIVAGLRDTQDVRGIAQQVVIRMATCALGARLMDCLEAILGALEKTLSERIKENAVRQETERYEESIKGAMRTICAIEKVPEVDNSREFGQFMARTVVRRFEDVYANVQREGKLMQVGEKRSTKGDGKDKMEE